MKIYKRNEKGVTLMILIITITVMLILAGVSVKIATGGEEKDGIVQTTTKERHYQFNMISNESQEINETIKNENGDDWGY